MSVVTNQVLIVGTGFAGLGMAIRLKQAGFHDFTILEQGAGVGGTWRDNHYPGAECDVHVRPPLLLLLRAKPALVAELRGAGGDPLVPRSLHGQVRPAAAHPLQRPGHPRELRRAERALDGRDERWTDAPRAALVSGCGGSAVSSYPEIPGLSSFEGKTFHSARWDHTYPLEGKRVGVIGTGASSIQIVPKIAPKVGKLEVFQRTPPWIMPKLDVAIPERMKTTFAAAPSLQQLARVAIYWLLESRAYAFVSRPELLKRAQPQSLRYLASRVKDPALRAKLTPSYTMGCKRTSSSPTTTTPRSSAGNVELVSDGIERVTRTGVVTTGGKEHALDALVCATGFQAAEASVAVRDSRPPGRGAI